MNGKETAHAARVAGKRGLSLISDERFRELYAALLKCRMLDERLPADAFYDRWRGREAVTAGVMACLRAGDCVIPTPRAMLALLLQNGPAAPSKSGTLTSAAPLAAATGEALRHKLEQTGGVTVVFADRGEPERLGEIISGASCQLLPILYVLNEGLQSSRIRSSGNKSSGIKSSRISGAVPAIRVDSLDTVAVYRVAHEAIQRARQGDGPTVMECATWPGDSETDSLQKLERYLAGKKLFRRAWKNRLEEEYAKALGDFGKTPIPELNEGEMGCAPVYTRRRNAVA